MEGTKIEWTAEKLKSFKKEYDKAITDKKTTFIFKDTKRISGAGKYTRDLEFNTGYAKYLIEYLTDQFK